MKIIIEIQADHKDIQDFFKLNPFHKEFKKKAEKIINKKFKGNFTLQEFQSVIPKSFNDKPFYTLKFS